MCRSSNCNFYDLDLKLKRDNYMYLIIHEEWNFVFIHMPRRNKRKASNERTDIIGCSTLGNLFIQIRVMGLSINNVLKSWNLFYICQADIDGIGIR